MIRGLRRLVDLGTTGGSVHDARYIRILNFEPSRTPAARPARVGRNVVPVAGRHVGTWTIYPDGERTACWTWTVVATACMIGTAALSHAYRSTGSDVELARIVNIVALAMITIGVSYYSHRAMTRAEAALAAERQETEDLLHNVLPASIADRLKLGESVADRFEAATVVFADLVGFTPRAEQMAPDRVVALLDDVFRRFDRLCDQHGLEKIKTIGDAYMAAAGIPIARPDHATAAAELALAMLGELTHLPGIELRIGIHTGPVVAGVIGARKFAYDLWGDTVNTASRMESHGIPGRIQVTASVHDLLQDAYVFESRGEIDVKGKGRMPVYLLVGPR